MDGGAWTQNKTETRNVHAGGVTGIVAAPNGAFFTAGADCCVRQWTME
jgi:hypothetical protein